MNSPQTVPRVPLEFAVFINMVSCRCSRPGHGSANHYWCRGDPAENGRSGHLAGDAVQLRNPLAADFESPLMNLDQ